MAAKTIKKPTKGGRVNKLWETVVDLVDAVNALQNITLSPQGIGEVKYAEGNVKIVFKTETCPTP